MKLLPGSQESFEQRLDAVITNLLRVGHEAGLDRDGPMAPVFEAQALVLRHLGDVIGEIRKVSVEHEARLVEKWQATRSADEAATQRVAIEMEKTKVRTIGALSQEIGQHIETMTIGRIHNEAWKLALWMMGILAVFSVSSLALGFWWGHGSAMDEIHETEATLRPAFREGTRAARIWAELIQWNDILEAVGQCRDQKAFVFTQSERRGCSIPLWVEPPLRPTDIRKATSLPRNDQVVEQAGSSGAKSSR